MAETEVKKIVDTRSTRTNRLEAVENMKKVIKIHGYKITEEGGQ